MCEVTTSFLDSSFDSRVISFLGFLGGHGTKGEDPVTEREGDGPRGRDVGGRKSKTGQETEDDGRSVEVSGNGREW